MVSSHHDRVSTSTYTHSTWAWWREACGRHFIAKCDLRLQPTSTDTLFSHKDTHWQQYFLWCCLSADNGWMINSDGEHCSQEVGGTWKTGKHNENGCHWVQADSPTGQRPQRCGVLFSECENDSAGVGVMHSHSFHRLVQISVISQRGKTTQRRELYSLWEKNTPCLSNWEWKHKPDQSVKPYEETKYQRELSWKSTKEPVPNNTLIIVMIIMVVLHQTNGS